MVYFFKQNTSYERRISDWSADVCSSDLSLFVYSDSAADMGNSSSDGEFAEHYGFLVKEKFRLTKPGRLTAVHCSDLPMTKWKDGHVGIKDFSGEIMDIHERYGWILHSRRTIWNCPDVEMTRRTEEQREGKTGVRTVRSRGVPN